MTGPTFQPGDDILCSFGKSVDEAYYLDKETVVCVVPEGSEGVTEFEIEIIRSNIKLRGRATFRYGMIGDAL